jgi:Heterokaryon incompatibility protein (HET)
MLKYQYRPIEASRRDIRLVRIHSKRRPCIHQPPEFLPPFIRRKLSPHESLIHCDIIHSSLDFDTPVFRALSYTWGDPTRTRLILADEAVLDITENLLAALVQLQADDHDVTLWIDAICINQIDDVEKSWQVQQMYQIYQKAQSVIVWLGSGADDSDLVMERLVEAGGLAESNKAISEAIRKVRFAEDNSATFPLPATLHFLQRPWFSRIWVKQEISAARSVTFTCGNKTIPDNLFFNAMILFTLARTNLVGGLNRAGRTLSLSEQKFASSLWDSRPADMAATAHGSHKGKGPLLRLLEDACIKSSISRPGLEATDPKDMIYGLLNLATDAEELGIEHDYTKPCEDIYTHAAVGLLKQASNLNLLSLSQLPKKQRGIPSWVPDWSSSPRPPIRDVKGAMPFHASGSSVATIDFDEKSRTLKVSGIQFDTVSVLGDPRGPRQAVDESAINLSIADRETGLDFISELLRLVRSKPSVDGSPYPTGEQILEAVWRTAIVDQETTETGDWVRAQESSHRGFTYYIEDPYRGMGPDPELQLLASRYFTVLWTMTEGKRPFLSKKGYLGLGSMELSMGDIIAVLSGAEVPFILRPDGSGLYKLIGEAYVHGIMNGEANWREADAEIFELS